MNPVPLFLIIVTLPPASWGVGRSLLAEAKPVEKKVLEVKEKVKPEEPVAETKPELEGVNSDGLEIRGDLLNGTRLP